MIACLPTLKRSAPFRTVVVLVELQVSAEDDTALSPKIDHALHAIGVDGLEQMPARQWFQRLDGVRVRYSYKNFYRDWDLVWFRWKEDARSFLRGIWKCIRIGKAQ